MPTDEHLQLARDYYEISGIFALTLHQMKTIVSASLEPLGDTPLAPHLPDLRRFVGERILYTKGALLEGITLAFVEHFNEDEIRSMITFYQTPAGQKMARSGISLADQIEVTSRRWGKALSAALIQKMESLQAGDS